MTVSATHPDYDKMLPKWERCIVVAKGQDAVHACGVEFLPQLADQLPDEYMNYKKRALFFNATWRTIVGLQGMIFRKPPIMLVGAVIEPMLKDITLSGKSLQMFALELTEECLKTGRVGVFVDYPTVDTKVTTQADAKLENHRPMLRAYTAKAITNWKTRTYKNATVLSLVVLKECLLVPKDEFADDEKEQFRVLDLYDVVNLDKSVQTIYRVRVMHEELINNVMTDVTDSTAYPMINGKFLDSIPFQFIGVDDTSWEVDEPPLIDLVDTNLSHYRVTADYEHGCHFTGLPTPVISGYTPTDGANEKFYIGSMTAWVFPNAQAKATFLEFTGQGLTALEKNLERKENMMAVLGARMLEAQPSGVESADTAAIHRGGEQSMLASVAQAISIGVQRALEVFAKFAGSEEEVTFELNRDFFPIPMDALTLTAIIAGWQNQAYSYETMFENLRKGEIVPMDADADAEQKAIDANPPPIPDVPTTPGNRAGNGPAKGAAKGTNSKKGTTSSNPTITQMQNK